MTFVAPSVLSVLELFNGPLAGMRFADVDAEGLALLATNIERAGVEVASAEAKLNELRQLLATEQDALIALAQRALAYARVYAESNDELMAQLNGIALPRLTRPTKARKTSTDKAPDGDSAGRGSAAAAVESAAAEADLAPAAEAMEAREVELDPELKEVEAAPGPGARKSRRNRLAPADAQAVAAEGASPSE